MAVSELTLIRSKLLLPSVAGLLHRPRVYQSIQQGLERKLTLISAPAGYGKTAALVDFAQHSPVPVCWYTVDERDRDLGVFVHYLVQAIAERFPGFGRRTRSALDSLVGDLFNGSVGVVGELVNEMLEIEETFVVVVDNYESLNGAFGIGTFVRRLLEVLPPNCHLMMGSRVLPDIPVTLLVAKRQLVGLTQQDLRFDSREIRDLLRLSGIEISDPEAERVAANSEGWITGILLLADLLREDATSVLLDTERATTGTYSFLAAEVLSRQPPDIRHFLRASAVLREMSSRLCREILQIKNPATLLAELERRNLFVTRFGREGAATYRYHHLFRDFLHEEFRRRDMARYVELHYRAGELFERENDVEEAVYHYLAAEEYRRATALMERVAREWFVRGRLETLLRWAEGLPKEIRSQSPRLLLYKSKALTDRYDYDEARRALADAEAGFAAREDQVHLAKVHEQRAVLALFGGHHQEAIAEAQVVLGMLAPGEMARRAEAQRLIGKAYVGLGRLAEGIAELQDSLALFRQAGSPYDVVNLLQDLVSALTAHGRLEEAAIYLNEALAVGRRLGAPKLLAGVLNNLGCLYYDRGKYRESLTLYEEGLAAARRGGDLQYQAYILVGLADLYRNIGDYERAVRLYNTGWQIAQQSEPRLVVHILTAQADMLRWQGEHTRALDLLRDARDLAEQRSLDFEQRGLLPVSEGIALAESGQMEAALRRLSDGVRFLEQRQAKRELARARFLLAKYYLLTDEQERAIAELCRALDLAEEIGTYQFAVAEGQHTEELLRLGVAQGVTVCQDILREIAHLQDLAEERGEPGSETDEDRVGRLKIYGLGEGRVVRDGRAISSSDWRAAMAKELFFYILLHGPLERDAIGLVFWPDLPAKSVTDTFHSTLYRVRRAVGADTVVLEEGRYHLGDVDYWFDVEEFERLIGRARLLPFHDWQAEDLWKRAILLYRGDFLSDVERIWAVPKREALREKYLEALISVGRCHEAREELERAVSWYRRALEVDELREDVHRRIMHSYARAGRRVKALTQYRRCQEALRQELGVEPSTETTRLYEQIAGKSESGR